MSIETENELRIRIGKELSDSFEKDHVSFIDFMVKSIPVRWLFFLSYRSLCDYNKIIPIENLPEKNKRALWEQTKEIANGRLNNFRLIELSYALYCLEYYLN
jgi:hypothetical protein